MKNVPKLHEFKGFEVYIFVAVSKSFDFFLTSEPGFHLLCGIIEGILSPKKMRERSNCLVAVKAKNTEERANFEEQPRRLRPAPPLLMLRPPPEPMAPIPLLLAASACRSSDIAAKVPPEIIKALSTHQTSICCLLSKAH